MTSSASRRSAPTVACVTTVRRRPRMRRERDGGGAVREAVARLSPERSVEERGGGGGPTGALASPVLPAPPRRPTVALAATDAGGVDASLPVAPRGNEASPLFRSPMYSPLAPRVALAGGLRVRGQRTKTTGRKGRTVGVSKKKG